MDEVIIPAARGLSPLAISHKHAGNGSFQSTNHDWGSEKIYSLFLKPLQTTPSRLANFFLIGTVWICMVLYVICGWLMLVVLLLFVYSEYYSVKWYNFLRIKLASQAVWGAVPHHGMVWMPKLSVQYVVSKILHLTHPILASTGGCFRPCFR